MALKWEAAMCLSKRLTIFAILWGSEVMFSKLFGIEYRLHPFYKQSKYFIKMEILVAEIQIKIPIKKKAIYSL